MLEASRLARNSSEWQQLSELGGLSPSGLSDQRAIDDPRDPNDRLWRGVKGPQAFADLLPLRPRIQAGRWNQAGKGRWQLPFPVGDVRAPDGAWDLDPARAQSANAWPMCLRRCAPWAERDSLVAERKRHGLDLPTLLVSKGASGRLVWKRPTLSAVVRILAPPADAGAQASGRWEEQGDQRSPKTGKARARLRPAPRGRCCSWSIIGPL